MEVNFYVSGINFKGEITVPHGKKMFSFIETKTVFQIACTILHSLQQCMTTIFSLFLPEFGLSVFDLICFNRCVAI